tara:strand:- start:24 stop:506 length:483 start_codon:yes stop_codon:yes gene_type:complete
MKIKEGDKLPDAKVFIMEQDPKEISIKEIIGNKKVILFGLPGAFTSTCSAKHLPGFIKNYDKFKTKGIDKIYCISVNDPYVMQAWGQANNANGKIIMLSDPFLNFTKIIGADVDKSSKGLGIRSNRYSMIINDLTILNLKEEKETKNCEISSAESFLNKV